MRPESNPLLYPLAPSPLLPSKSEQLLTDVANYENRSPQISPEEVAADSPIVTSPTEGTSGGLWQAIAEVEGFETGPIAESRQTEKQENKGALSWLRRNKVLVGAGVLCVGSLVANPVGDTLKSLSESGPVGWGLLAAEAVWIGGAVIASLAPGKDGQRTPLPRTLNPIKLYQAIKTRFNEIGEGADSSPWFRAGFAINGIAMLAQFVIPTVGIMANFAPKAWGLLAWPALELAGALVLRREILKRVRSKNSKVGDCSDSR